MNSGIYLLVNSANNKYYVGSAVDLDDRFRLHLLHLNRDSHHNRHLQAAWNTYGKDAFKFYVIEQTTDLLEREQFWIEKLQATNHELGYNICSTARNRKGAKASLETKQKLSDAHKGNTHSEETKAKMSKQRMGNKFNTGRKQTKEHKAAISASKIGHVTSLETRNKIGLGNKGKIISVETRQKMSLAARKRKKKVDNFSSLWA